MNQELELLRQFIREEASRIGGLGSRNIFTVGDSAITWDSLPGYNVDITPNVNGEYTLTVYHQGKKIGHSSQFNDYEEANHHARMVVDKHRVSSSK